MTECRVAAVHRCVAGCPTLPRDVPIISTQHHQTNYQQALKGTSLKINL